MPDQSAVGRASAPVHAVAEAGRLRRFLDAIDERNPIRRDPAAARAAGCRDLPVPPPTCSAWR